MYLWATSETKIFEVDNLCKISRTAKVSVIFRWKSVLETEEHNFEQQKLLEIGLITLETTSWNYTLTDNQLLLLIAQFVEK